MLTRGLKRMTKTIKIKHCETFAVRLTCSKHFLFQHDELGKILQLLILLYFSLTKNIDLTNLTFLLKANIKNTNLREKKKKKHPIAPPHYKTTLAIHSTTGNLVSCVDAVGLAADCTFCVDPVNPEMKTFVAVGWGWDAAAVLAVVLAAAQFAAVGLLVSKAVVVKLLYFSGSEDVGRWWVVWTECSFGLAGSFASPLVVVEVAAVVIVGEVVVVVFAFEMRLIVKTFVEEAFAAFEVTFETFEVAFETFVVTFETFEVAFVAFEVAFETFEVAFETFEVTFETFVIAFVGGTFVELAFVAFEESFAAFETFVERGFAAFETFVELAFVEKTFVERGFAAFEKVSVALGLFAFGVASVALAFVAFEKKIAAAFAAFEDEPSASGGLAELAFAAAAAAFAVR